jgi:hypothetical protein
MATHVKTKPGAAVAADVVEFARAQAQRIADHEHRAVTTTFRDLVGDPLVIVRARPRTIVERITRAA